MTKEMDITTTCFEVVDRVVGKAGHSGRVHVPIAWEGKKVRVLLLEPPNPPKKKSRSPRDGV